MNDMFVPAIPISPSMEMAGYVWAYRLILDRFPTSAEVEQAVAYGTPQAVVRALLISREFDRLFTGAGNAVEQIPASDRADAARWAFRLFLSREIGDETVVASVADSITSTADLRRMIAFSEEFRVRADKELEQLLTTEIAKDYKPFCTTPATLGAFNDFLGNTTRCSFLPDNFKTVSQSIMGPPGSTSSPPLHDASEWVGTLRAINEATTTFTVVELGAGWAPWLVAGFKLAERKGITDVHLMGVEADEGHMVFMEQNLSDNGIDPQHHRLIYGAVGASDGIARFPAIESSQEDYGSAAVYENCDSSRPMIEVPCFSLAGLLESLPHIVDLIHCDIQGSEAEVMAATSATLDNKVRRVVIGTHSRVVEGLLIDQFSAMGWKLEHETVCTYVQQDGGKMALHVDGVQVWRNQKV